MKKINPKKSDYSQGTPYVPQDKKADKLPIPLQNASLGNEVSKTIVPQQPNQFGKPPIGGTHGFGHTPKQKHWNLRVSGAPAAHHLGKK